MGIVNGGSGGVLAYVEFTAAVAITATTEDTANQIVSAGAVTFDGNPVLIQFGALWASILAGTTSLQFWLYQDGASIGSPAYLASTDILYTPVYFAQRLKPTAGSHTYSVRAAVNAGANCQVDAGAGGHGNDRPGFILISRST